MDTLSLRPVNEGDQDFLLELYASTRPDLAEIACDAGTRAQLVRMQYEAQQHHYRAYYPRATASVVLGDDGTRLGRIYVDRGPNEIRLVDISLLPAYRGHGLGRRLLEALMEEGEQLGLPVRLSVMAGNPAAHLYQRLGFAPGELRGVHQTMEWRACLGEHAPLL